MDLKKELQSIVMSLYKVVQGEYKFYIKKYSIIKSQFGVDLQLYIFKNSSGLSIDKAEMTAKGIASEFKKDLMKNPFVALDRILMPDINDMTIYGGKNQAYIGFTKIVYCNNIEEAIKIFKQIGYTNCDKDYTKKNIRNKFF